MAACERKGLAAKTMGSYEQTLRLLGQFLSAREIERTEEVKRVHIESYIDYVDSRPAVSEALCSWLWSALLQGAFFS